jgi:RND family efflux transporter MFP subunit
MTRTTTFGALAAGLIVLGCGASASLPDPAAAEPPGPLAAAETLSVALPLRVPATVYVENDALVHARAAGIVEWIGADLGTRVGAGQLIGRLEHLDQELALGRARETHAAAVRLVERSKQLLAAGGATSVELEDAETSLRQADLALRQAQRDLDLTRVVAPFAGTVSARWARRGRLAAEGDSLFRVTALSPLLAAVQVPEAAAAGLSPGDTVVAETAEGTARGRVVRLAPVVDAASGTREVVVSLASRAGLVPGAATTVIVSGKPRRVVAVPAAAVSTGGVVTVWTADGSVVRPVTTGAELPDGRVEVVAGLAAGDRVVLPAR